MSEPEMFLFCDPRSDSSLLLDPLDHGAQLGIAIKAGTSRVATRLHVTNVRALNTYLTAFLAKYEASAEAWERR